MRVASYRRKEGCPHTIFLCKMYLLKAKFAEIKFGESKCPFFKMHLFA
jgi:hypothetical protein